MRTGRTILILLLLAGCTQPRTPDPVAPQPVPAPPQWTRHPRYPGCEGPDWLHAVGIGEGETLSLRHDRALNHAREQLAASIRIQVQAEWHQRAASHMEERWGPEGQVYTERLEEVIDRKGHSYTAAVLTGVDAKDRYDDGRTAQVICVLYLPRFCERLRLEIREQEALAAAARAQAATVDANQPVRRLGHLGRALAAYGAAQARRQTLSALGGGHPEGDDAAMLGFLEVQDGIASFAAALQLERTGGQGVMGSFDAPLPERPALRLTLGGAPLPGCPIRFRFLDGAGRLDESPQHTDADGRASVEVYRTERTGRAQQRIEAVMDLTAIAGDAAEALAAGLGGPPRIEFTYYLPTPETTRLAFDIRESQATGFDGDSLIATHGAADFLADRARAEGFGLLPAEGLPEGPTLAAKLKSLMDRREGYSYLLCTGTVELRAQPSESFKYYLRARVNIELTDLASGKVLVRIDDRTLPYQPKGLSQTSYAQAAEQFFRQRGAFPLVAARLLLALHGEFISDQAALAERRRAVEVWGGEMPLART